MGDIMLGEKDTIELSEIYFQQAKNILQEKKLSMHQINRAKRFLQQCQKMNYQNVWELEQMLGRVNLLEAKARLQKNRKCDVQNYIVNAKMHYYMALTENQEETLSRLGLFLASLLEENYKEAYLELETYDTPDYDFSLVYALLNFLMDKETSYEPIESTKILNGEVTFPPIIRNYYLAGCALKENNFDKVVKHLEICHNLSLQKDTQVDFSWVLILAKRLFEKRMEAQKEEIKTLYAKEKHVGNRMLLSQKLLEVDRKDADSHFYFMDSYMALKVFSPLIDECELLRKIPLTQEQADMVSLYERLIYEKQLEEMFGKELNYLSDTASKLELEGAYEEALTHYEYGYGKMKVPYLQLKVAEVSKKLGDTTSAIQYAEEYLQEGYCYYEEASTFLYLLYRETNNREKAMQVAMDCYHKTRMNAKGCSLSEWMKRLNVQYEEDTKDGVEISPVTGNAIYQKIKESQCN